VVDLFHEYNVKVFAHIPQTCTKIDGTIPLLEFRPLNDPEGGVLAQMDRDAKTGIDGFKIDCVYNFSPHLYTVDEWREHEAYSYYKAIYDKAKSLGLPCLMNTGTYYVSEVLMELCDILGLEGGWETFVSDSRFDWRKNYDRYRFEGYNDEIRVPFGGEPFTVTTGLDLAVSTTFKAWNNGVGWHHCGISNKDVRYPLKSLPDWWEEYLELVGFSG